MNKLLSESFQKSHTQNMINSFSQRICDIREYTETELKELHFIDQNFITRFEKLARSATFNNYSAIAFFWITLVEDFFFLCVTHADLESEILSSDNKEDAIDELFEFWNESEHAKNFQEIIDNGINITNASLKLLPLLENQVLSFYFLHLNTGHNVFAPPITYQAIFELGDCPLGIFTGENHKYFSFNHLPTLFPFLNIENISPDQIQTKEVVLNYQELKTKLVQDSNVLHILPTCLNGHKQLEKIKTTILQALNIISQYSPELLKTFHQFTHTIVILDNPEVISYSIQNLPGFSVMNLFNRDFIDTMNDLIHENGHHYLNTILNHCELINDDNEKKFYCPWKKSLKPINEIYHCYFTFSWTLQLLATLAHYILNNKDSFSQDEKRKILTQLCKEKLMLDFCLPYLKQAHIKNKITDEGLNLINEVANIIEKQNTLVLGAQNELSLNHSQNWEQVCNLKELLAQK